MRSKYFILVIALLGFSVFVGNAAVENTDMFSETGKFISNDGAFLYKQNCLSCHMAEGKGVHTGVGMYPMLASNPALEMPEYTAGIIINGYNGMPSFDAELTDEQVAAIANYLAVSFGNKGTEQTTAEKVKELRPNVPIRYTDL